MLAHKRYRVLAARMPKVMGIPNASESDTFIETTKRGLL